MYTIENQLNTPCNLAVEITTVCNHSCRYCYNFWRHDRGSNEVIVSRETLDAFIDDMVANKVFSVVLTGGEPFANFDVLLHGVKRLTDEGILVSCNSNLTLASREQLQALHDAGLPHILTSLACIDPEINDRIFGCKGAYAKTIKNILNAVDIGIKMSVNLVVSRDSKDHVYQTGLFAHALGAANLFLTRVIPSTSCTEDIAEEFLLDHDEYVSVLDAAIKLREDTGINVGSLIQYPVCFLRDVEKYKDFLGRGCPAGTKMICINANGETHACFHENKSYGNILDIGLKGVWENVKLWRDGTYIPQECRECKWLRWCEGGCRVFADSLDSRDYMCRGPEGLPDPVEDWQKSIDKIVGGSFRVRQGMRFREETGFWLAHIVGAWIAQITPEVADFLQQRSASQQQFSPEDFPGSDRELADLLTKNIIDAVS